MFFSACSASRNQFQAMSSSDARLFGRGGNEKAGFATRSKIEAGRCASDPGR